MGTDESRPYVEAVEATMRQALEAPSPALEPLYAMMRYHLGWADEGLRPTQAPGGKRVRPMLCLLSCEAVSGHWSAAVPVAASIELIHSFSLVHDDIEDASPTRRHRPTLWKLWGVPQAVNTGDAMFTIARLAIHRVCAHALAPDLLLGILQRIEESTLAICEGQYLDLAFETETDVTLDRYLHMVEGKTAALLACACETGALAGGGATGPHAGFRTFGHELGMAFQFVDDILGIWGDPAVTGKPAADDIRSRKKTIPLLRALQVLPPTSQERLRRVLSRPQLTEDEVGEAIGLLAQAGAREYCEELARQHTSAALAALEVAVPPSPARTALSHLALQLVGREA